MTRRRLAVSSLLLLFVAILAVYCSQTVQQQSTETKPAWLRRLDDLTDPSGSDASDITESTDATTTDSSSDGSGDGDPTDVETEPPAAGMADAPAAAPTEPAAGAPTAPAPETTKAPAPKTTHPTAPTTTGSPAPKTTNPPTTSPTKAAAPKTTNPPTTSPTKAPAPKATDPPVSSPTEDATDSSDLDTDTGTYDYSLDAPTDKPVTYVPPDDDPVKDEDEDFTGEATDGGKFTWNEGETPEEMAHDPNVAILVGVLCGVALLLMIITAQQMLENPDGFCASLCRLLVSCNCCIFRTICPCLACCCRKSKRGHLPMMTDDNDFTHDLELS